MDKDKILEELGGLPEEVYDDLCRLMKEDAKQKISELYTAVDANDYATIKIIAHGLKGSAGNLRIEFIREKAAGLEQAVLNKASQDHLRNLLNSLNQALENFNI